VFEKRALKGIFGPSGSEVTGGWRKLHNEKLRNLYSSPSIIRMMKSRRMRLAENVARLREKRNAYRISVGKPEGKRPIARHEHRWVRNVKMDLRRIGWGGTDWSDLGLGWRTVECSCEHGNELSVSMKILTKDSALWN
jgi:hypothetical protein